MRPIDADKIPYLHVDGFGMTSYAHHDDINKMPTIDPIKAAGGCYCRECMHRNEHGHCAHPRHEILPTTYPNDFCSYGEPREAQDDG